MNNIQKGDNVVNVHNKTWKDRTGKVLRFYGKDTVQVSTYYERTEQHFSSGNKYIVKGYKKVTWKLADITKVEVTN